MAASRCLYQNSTKVAKNAEDDQRYSLAIFDKVGHLRGQTARERGEPASLYKPCLAVPLPTSPSCRAERCNGAAFVESDIPPSLGQDLRSRGRACHSQNISPSVQR